MPELAPTRLTPPQYPAGVPNDPATVRALFNSIVTGAPVYAQHQPQTFEDASNESYFFGIGQWASALWAGAAALQHGLPGVAVPTGLTTQLRQISSALTTLPQSPPRGSSAAPAAAHPIPASELQSIATLLNQAVTQAQTAVAALDAAH